MPPNTDKDPLVDAAFVIGITAAAFLLFARIAVLAWSFLTQIWAVLVLLFAAIVSFLYFFSAFRQLWYEPMRTDVSLEGIETADLDDEPAKPEPVKVQHTPAVQEEPKREVIIDTDKLLACAAHWRDLLQPEEENYLSRQGYELKHFVPFGETHAQPCLIKKNKVESYEHTFVVSMIAHELRNYTKKVETFITQYPDVVFECKGKQYAVEVETPFGLPQKHRRLALKATENNKQYGSRWVFVATQSAYAKCFKRYAHTLRRNDVPDWIDELFAKKSPLKASHPPPPTLPP